jgi:hypothetical protein
MRSKLTIRQRGARRPLLSQAVTFPKRKKHPKRKLEIPKPTMRMPRYVREPQLS